MSAELDRGLSPEPPMIEGLSTALNGLALVVLAISVVFMMKQTEHLARQSVQLSEALTVESSTALLQSFAQVSQAFLAYPNLRTVFYQDEGPAHPLVTLEDRSRATSIAEMLCDLMESWFLLRDDSQVFKRVGAEYTAYTTDIIRMSEFLTDYLLQRSEWYHDDLVVLARAARAERIAGT